jgi:hypothetical protein
VVFKGCRAWVQREKQALGLFHNRLLHENTQILAFLYNGGLRSDFMVPAAKAWAKFKLVRVTPPKRLPLKDLSFSRRSTDRGKGTAKPS